jgi:hypothetical protein
VGTGVRHRWGVKELTRCGHETVHCEHPLRVGPRAALPTQAGFDGRPPNLLTLEHRRHPRRGGDREVVAVDLKGRFAFVDCTWATEWTPATLHNAPQQVYPETLN